MSSYSYDLHIHSCLSPCGDDESTPSSIAGIAVLNGVRIAALTDHNTTRNCPAFCKAARVYGLIPVPGMELSTSEDIHVVCLFPSLELAMQFNEVVKKRLIRVKNDPVIFGDQFVMDEDDNVIDREEDLLINATTISVEEAFEIVNEIGGVCYPAHIDREANGIVAILGTFPDDPPFTAFEIHDREKEQELRERFPVLRDLTCMISSDAHDLSSISTGENSVELDDEPYSSKYVIENLFAHIRSGQRPSGSK